MIENARRLCNFLKANGVVKGSYVNRAVILAQDTSIDSLSAGTEIWKLHELPSKLVALNNCPPVERAQTERIMSLLMEHKPEPALVN